MYKIDEVFNQAMEDFHSIKPTDFSAINNGVKIQKFPSKTEILNCGRSGDYFQECNKEEYKLFFKYGWREGGVRLSMVNCKRKLGMIEERIRAEVNTRKNDKHIQKLKVSREKLLLKYSNRTQQLNKIKSNGKEKHL